MKKSRYPHWIKHSHFFDCDTYECSECGKCFKQKAKACPNCGAVLRVVDDDLGWIDELEELDMILGND